MKQWVTSTKPERLQAAMVAPPGTPVYFRSKQAHVLYSDALWYRHDVTANHMSRQIMRDIGRPYILCGAVCSELHIRMHVSVTSAIGAPDLLASMATLNQV